MVSDRTFIFDLVSGFKVISMSSVKVTYQGHMFKKNGRDGEPSVSQTLFVPQSF